MGQFSTKSKAIALVFCPILTKSNLTDFDGIVKSAKIGPIFDKKYGYSFDILPNFNQKLISHILILD